ncbi:IDEAL domain-containing protein [Mesobacillus harenae]|uniref:IDEAL domain-containing protein n=1 Tax=Mesobacillus harenae TaxID=2213203 RepID=UPI00157FF0CD|nr:IDEAL domain-containing protein [Mesobacillus harenae]
MKSDNNSILKTGDWVKGKSENGELIIGFIESLDILNGAVRVSVVKSDNEETVGKKILMGNRAVKVIPDSNVSNKEQLLYLVDLALLTGDKEWFFELSSKLNSMKELVKTDPKKLTGQGSLTKDGRRN